MSPTVHLRREVSLSVSPYNTKLLSFIATITSKNQLDLLRHSAVMHQHHHRQTDTTHVYISLTVIMDGKKMHMGLVYCLVAGPITLHWMVRLSDLVGS